MQIVDCTNRIDDRLFQQIQQIHEVVFNGAKLKREKLTVRKNPLYLVVLEEEQVIGFKFGYEQEEGYFYSWLGGVSPIYQGQGVAKELMAAQHTIAREKGYKHIRTYGRNEKRAMLYINLKAGFNIIRTFEDDGVLKIVFEKEL